MQLRNKLEPDLKTAEQRYPEILNAILAYTDFCDAHGDEHPQEYKKLKDKLHLITGKEMSRFNLSEWWEEEGAEPLAFKISLPDPVIVDDISREELTEIVSRLKTFDDADEDDQRFFSQFRHHLDSYYHALLASNFKGYDPKFFQRNKDKNGKYFEYQAAEIVARIMPGG